MMPVVSSCLDLYLTSLIFQNYDRQSPPSPQQNIKQDTRVCQSNRGLH